MTKLELSLELFQFLLRPSRDGEREWGRTGTLRVEVEVLGYVFPGEAYTVGVPFRNPCSRNTRDLAYRLHRERGRRKACGRKGVQSGQLSNVGLWAHQMKGAHGFPGRPLRTALSTGPVRARDPGNERPSTRHHKLTLHAFRGSKYSLRPVAELVPTARKYTEIGTVHRGRCRDRTQWVFHIGEIGREFVNLLAL
jgi:hypothetical protein